jgi:kinesin family protein C1
LGEELAGIPGDDPNPPHITFVPDGKSLEMEKLAETGCNEVSAQVTSLFLLAFFYCFHFQSILSRTINPASGNGKGKYAFHFDTVFSPSATQAVVFDEISQLVQVRHSPGCLDQICKFCVLLLQSSLDGYQVTIFAYGQTGSGKTFTMEGSRQSPDSHGMIPRAVEQVFETTESLRKDGWQYELQVSFLEIYNEKIRDLLGNPKEDVKHELKKVSANSAEVMVTNLTLVSVDTPDMVSSLTSLFYGISRP